MVKLFSPQNHQDATHKNRTENNANETSTHNVSQDTKTEDATPQKISTGEINNNKTESATAALFNNTCTCKNASCMPLWINKGKVFGKFKPVEKDQKPYVNKCSALDNEDASQCTNETGIVYGIAENIAIKEENDTLKQQLQKITDHYEIEKMTLHEIKEHLKHAEEVYDAVIKEGDNKISSLKDEKHKQTIKYHRAQKEIDKYKHQAKKSKTTLNQNEKVRARLTNDLKNIGVKMKMHEDMKSYIGKLESALVMKSNAIIYLRKRIKDYEES